MVGMSVNGINASELRGDLRSGGTIGGTAALKLKLRMAKMIEERGFVGLSGEKLKVQGGRAFLLTKKRLIAEDIKLVLRGDSVTRVSISNRNSDIEISGPFVQGVLNTIPEFTTLEFTRFVYNSNPTLPAVVERIYESLAILSRNIRYSPDSYTVSYNGISAYPELKRFDSQ